MSDTMLLTVLLSINIALLVIILVVYFINVSPKGGNHCFLCNMGTELDTMKHQIEDTRNTVYFLKGKFASDEVVVGDLAKFINQD